MATKQPPNYVKSPSQTPSARKHSDKIKENAVKDDMR